MTTEREQTQANGDHGATCAVCGTVAPDGPPLTWTVQQSDRGRGSEYVCDACARQNIRAIEGRLDATWW